MGQDILVPANWVCMTAPSERCIGEKKARSRCLCGLWQGEQGCVRVTDKFLLWQRLPNWNLWEPIYNKMLLTWCLAVMAAASQERWHKDKAPTSHIPSYHHSFSLAETKSFLVWWFWKPKEENLSNVAVLGRACKAWQSSVQNFSIAGATKDRMQIANWQARV